MIVAGPFAAWRERAACLGADTALFFSIRHVDKRAARAFCAGCPVVDECLTDALLQGDFGIRGGMTERERENLARYRAARCAQCGRPMTSQRSVVSRYCSTRCQHAAARLARQGERIGGAA